MLVRTSCFRLSLLASDFYRRFMADKIVAAHTYTDQELLDIWRECSATISRGQSYTIAGRMYQGVDAAEVRENIRFYESRVNDSAPMANNLVKFGRR